MERLKIAIWRNCFLCGWCSINSAGVVVVSSLNLEKRSALLTEITQLEFWICTRLSVFIWTGKKGGSLASAVHSYLNHGDPAVCATVSHLLTIVGVSSLPLFYTFVYLFWSIFYAAVFLFHLYSMLFVNRLHSRFLRQFSDGFMMVNWTIRFAKYVLLHFCFVFFYHGIEFSLLVSLSPLGLCFQGRYKLIKSIEALDRDRKNWKRYCISWRSDVTSVILWPISY